MKSTEILQNAFTGTLVLCALVITGLFARRELMPRTAPADPAPVATERNWRTYVAGPHRYGPAGARVTLVEFSDFQCPYCRLPSMRLDSLRAEFPNDLQIVFRHFPLPSHRHAVTAALASECAGDQGRFWPMHDALYHDQGQIGAVPWTTYARIAEVPDSRAFEQCMSHGDLSRVRADSAAGRRLGISGTPTLLINEHRITGAPPLDSLRAQVQRTLSERSATTRA